MTDRTYARFYYAEFIRDYPHIYADDAAFAAWVRLLATAEAMWPAHPELPRSVKTRTLAKLSACGLIDTDGMTYSVKGMDAERTRRRDAARNAAAHRWHSEGSTHGNANGNAESMPSRAETRSITTKGKQGVRPLASGPALVDPVTT